MTLDRINMVVVDGAALHFEKTLDSTARCARRADEADVRRMYAGLVASVASGSSGRR